MKKVLGVLTLLAVLQVTYVNCGRVGFDANKGLMSGLNLGSEACDQIVKQTYAQTYFPLLSTNCYACHSGEHGSTDLNTSYQAFKIKTVNLINSRATNPHGGNAVNLTSEIAAIQSDWEAGQTQFAQCVADANSQTPEEGMPPGPPTGGMNPPIQATFSSIFTNILQPKCVACHNTNSAPKGVSYSYYTDAMATVEPNNPNSSLLYTAVNTDLMPLAGVKLSAEEKTAIRTWIENGANNN